MAATAAGNFFQLSFSRNPSSGGVCLSLPGLGASLNPRSPMAPAFCMSPAVAQANVLYFRSGYNVQIVVDDNEPEEALLRRFRQEVSKAGVILECKRRRFFENKQEEKKRKAREASRRFRRRRSGPRFPSSTDGNAGPKKGEGDDAEDNWEMPEGDLPY